MVLVNRNFHASKFRRSTLENQIILALSGSFSIVQFSSRHSTVIIRPVQRAPVPRGVMQKRTWADRGENHALTVKKTWVKRMRRRAGEIFFVTQPRALIRITTLLSLFPSLLIISRREGNFPLGGANIHSFRHFPDGATKRRSIELGCARIMYLDRTLRNHGFCRTVRNR